MRSMIDTIGGLWELLVLAARSGFRMNNSYWNWRKETAFGSNPARIPLGERIAAILEYGRWVYRIKRGR